MTHPTPNPNHSGAQAGSAKHSRVNASAGAGDFGVRGTGFALHPFLALSAGASAWLLVLGINHPVLSAAVVVLSLLVGTLAVRNASVVLTSLALSIPAALSMVLVHAPFGEERFAKVLSLDGLQTAGELSIRFAALVTVILAAMATIRLPELLKALQVARLGGLGPRLSLIVGQTFALVPQATHARYVVRDTLLLRGEKVRGVKAAFRISVLVIVQVITWGADRAQPLQTAGLGIAGPKTLMRPLAYPTWQKVLACVLPVCAIAATVLWHTSQVVSA